MPHIVKRSFYEGDTLHEAGTLFEHSDAEYVAKCLEDGNIADATEEEITEFTERATANAVEVAGIQEAETARHEAMHAPVVTENPTEVKQEDAPLVPTAGQPTPEDIQATLSSAGLDASSGGANQA